MLPKEVQEKIDRLKDMEEDWTGHRDEVRRQILITAAVEAADRILLDGSDGSEEELNFLTAAVAAQWAGKTQIMAAARLLKKTLLGELDAARRDPPGEQPGDLHRRAGDGRVDAS